MAEVNRSVEDTLSEFFDLWGGSLSETLTTILGRKVSFNPGKVSILELSALKQEYSAPPRLYLELVATGDYLGNLYLLLEQSQAAVITDLVIGGDGQAVPEEFGESQFSVLQEAISQGIQSLGSILEANLPKKVKLIFKEVKPFTPDLFSEDKLAVISLSYALEGLPEGKFELVASHQFMQDLAEGIKQGRGGGGGSQVLDSQAEASGAEASHPLVRPAEFQPLSADSKKTPPPEGLERIFDIPVQLTAVLGRSEVQLRDLLDISAGTLLELDKLAGEPVELFVNGKLIALGEVVVVDEKFGINVVEVVSPMERLSHIQAG